MRKKTVALYDPYLDTMGGGEKHALSILKALTEENFDSIVFWDTDVSSEIKQKLHLNIKDIRFEKNIFKNSSYSIFEKMKALSKYDIFIYMTDGSYFVSTARKNIIFALVPDKTLFNMNIGNKLKTLNSQFVTNSFFSQSQLENWGVKAKVLYPFLDNELLSYDPSNTKKEKIIFSVGRFFKHLHAKRHDVMIEYFKKLKKDIPLLSEYKLILAGGLKEEDKDYFNELQTLARDDTSIICKPNVPYEELVELYKKAQIYWHFAGFGVNESEHPERTEHFGISPVEAMAYGCSDFCYKAGGLKETIKDTVTGYLFSSYDELKEKMQNYFLTENHTEMQTAAKTYLNETFNYDIFKKHVKEIFLS
jgi:glycosyltransferase involved in cell wall biosynthesis